MTPASPNITCDKRESTGNRHLDSTNLSRTGEESAKISVKGVTFPTLKETLLVLAGFIVSSIIVLAFLAYLTAVLG